jgi:hypothetical protein
MENKKIKCAFYFQTFLGMVARVRRVKQDLSVQARHAQGRQLHFVCAQNMKCVSVEERKKKTVWTFFPQLLDPRSFFFSTHPHQVEAEIFLYVLFLLY